MISRKASGWHQGASGRFLVRIDAGLHELLKEAARDAGISLNEYCVRALAAHGAGLVAHADAAQAISKAASLFGADLIGIVAYGSWARGELAEGSDVDLLLVLEARVELTRDLYRRWDASAVQWSGRPVDAHFAHLPQPGVPPSGMWAEVAIDGIVIFERGLRLSEHLVRVRRDIAAGRLVRRVVHGQPYWTEVA
ncbi:MAG: nucleotidyltransferase domain-containing protein [Candidatus Rokubacteria bacterium]|nr:nucleotidyltransferase domain-containing protein [Candidatus Rokubacteria bacterium]